MPNWGALKDRALRMVAAHWSDYPLGTSRSGVGGRDLATRFGFKAAHQIEQPLGDAEHQTHVHALDSPMRR